MSVSVRRMLALAAFGCVSLGIGQGAWAQYYPAPGYPYNAPPPYPGPPPIGNRFFGYARPIPPDDVVDRLEDQGYRDVAEPRFNGSTYVTVATRGRERVRLVVDAFRGVVIGQSPAMRRDARRFEEEERSTAYWPRRPDAYGGPPPASPPVEAPRPRAVAPPAPETRGPAEARLPAPADTRLAPRATPVAPSPGGPVGAVEGTNPDAAARPAPAAKPRSREASRPKPAAPVPGGQPPAAPPPANAEAQSRPDRPVRVIQGVTPLNGPASTPPAAPPQEGAASQPAAPE